jgi:uncharacterized protein (TIGR02996 family)
MSDEAALLAAIWDQPHEDTPRLVYADWLQENGQPERAEFIRVQCELAKFDEDDEGPEKAELEKRESRLLRKHGKAWRAELPPKLRRGPFRRGFPAPAWDLTVRQFLQLTAEDVSAAPLWAFGLKGAAGVQFSRIAAAPAFARSRKLGFYQGASRPSPEDIRVLTGARAARNLSDLGLDFLQVEDGGVRALASGADLPRLSRVGLSGNRLTDAAVTDLGAWPGAAQLQELSLGWNQLGDPSLEVIATGPLGRGLRTLVLGNNPGFTTAGLIRLIESPAAASLRLLNVIRSEGVTDEFAAALAASPRSRALRHLVIPETPIGDRGVSAILRSPYLQDLRFLNLGGCGLRRGGRVLKELDGRFGGYGSGFGGWRLRPPG